MLVSVSPRALSSMMSWFVCLLGNVQVQPERSSVNTYAGVPDVAQGRDTCNEFDGRCSFLDSAVAL